MAYPLKSGDVISFGHSLFYSVDHLENGTAKISLLEEARPSASEYPKVDSKEFPVTEQGAIIGKS